MAASPMPVSAAAGWLVAPLGERLAPDPKFESIEHQAVDASTTAYRDTLQLG